MPHPDHEKNRAAWDKMAEVHWNHPDYKVKDFLDGWNSIKSIEREQVGDVAGKSLLHLQCQFGMDTLSWARYGAKVTGVDISEVSIKYANQLKEMAELNEAKFICSDVLELIGKTEETFDVVFQSYGTHCWISDLFTLAEVVAHHLKPGGIYYIIDTHPIMIIYETESMTYLDKRPERYANVRDYCDFDYIVKEERVEWQHPISEFINAFVKAGLVIESLDEYDKGFYNVEADWYRDGDYWYPPDGPTRYPMMFSMKARKPN